VKAAGVILEVWRVWLDNSADSLFAAEELVVGRFESSNEAIGNVHNMATVSPIVSEITIDEDVTVNVLNELRIQD
jgi:hypothetical protein